MGVQGYKDTCVPTLELSGPFVRWWLGRVRIGVPIASRRLMLNFSEKSPDHSKIHSCKAGMPHVPLGMSLAEMHYCAVLCCALLDVLWCALCAMPCTAVLCLAKKFSRGSLDRPCVARAFVEAGVKSEAPPGAVGEALVAARRRHPLPRAERQGGGHKTTTSHNSPSSISFLLGGLGLGILETCKYFQ